MKQAIKDTKFFLISLGLLTVVALFLTPAVLASPIISIGEGTSTNWTQAMAAGNVQAYNGPLSDAAQDFYTNQVAGDPDIDSFQIIEPILAPDLFVSDSDEEHQSLVMSWGDSPGDDSSLDIAAWEYVYDADPDLTNTIIEFSLFAPPGIWDVSIELIDDQNRSRGWFMSMPNNTWQNLSINPSIAALQGPFNAFHQTPGFDITKVLSIRLDEAGNSSSLFPPNQQGLPPMWNAWDHLTVRPIPEPSTIILLGIGVAVLGGGYLRRKRSQKTK